MWPDKDEYKATQCSCLVEYYSRQHPLTVFTTIKIHSLGKNRGHFCPLSQLRYQVVIFSSICFKINLLHHYKIRPAIIYYSGNDL